MTKSLFDKAQIDSATCDGARTKSTYFDLGCRGLMLEVRPTGRKTYYFRYIDERGVQRQHRIGDARDLGLEAARRVADRLRSRVLDGQNLVEQRAQLRKTPKFGQFVQESYLPFIRSYKRSGQTDESLLNNHLLPCFANRYMDTVTTRDVQEFIGERRLSLKPSSLNRLLIVLRFIYNQALKWETPGVKKNPTAGIRMLRENNKKERYLTVEETQRLYEQLCRSENPSLKYIVSMLILTGARKGEVLESRWEDFDLPKRLWRIPMTKSGEARHVPLSDGVETLLHKIGVKPLGYVFLNPVTRQPFKSIFNAWNAARTRAGLKDVRIHDLRHSFASLLVNEGRSLYEVQKILGHSQIKTTQRYAHLANQTLVDAANVATRALGASMDLNSPNTHH